MSDLNESPGSHQQPDALLDRLIFLARFFGQTVEAGRITGGVPLTDGRITLVELDECAARAGLTLSAARIPAMQIRASMLPALLVDQTGDALTVLHRRGDEVEVAAAGIDGSKWIALDLLQKEHPGRWFFVRPIFRFDARSLLYHLPRPRRWFWDAFLANRWIYGWALLATVLVNLFGAVIPFYTMAVYDRVVPNNALDSLWVLTSAAVTITVFDLVMKLLRSYLVESAARKADLAMSSHVFAHALQLRAASRPASGGVLANVVRDFESVREFASSATLNLLGDMPFMLFFLAVIAMIGGWMVAVPLLLIPLTLGVSWWLRKPISTELASNMQEGAQRTAHLFEVMNGLDTVKGMGADAWARRKWEMLTVKISESTLRMREWSAFGSNFAIMMTGLSTVLLVMVGALLIADGKLSLGQLIAVSMLSSRALAPASQLAGLILRSQQVKMSLEALDKIMISPIDEHSGALHMPTLEGRIEFRDVHFAYPNSPPLLKGLNLRIAPGEKVGFIGRIGSGKSTLMRMLLNIYSPDQGAVLIDGLSVKQIEPLSLRRQIGYVPQDVVLFHGDIRENILLGASDVSDADLLQAIRGACLEDTLAQLPQGLGSEVGERGERLSGGQRQAVAIARALVRRPRLLLLDEPSSMMDPATEFQLIQNLRKVPDMTMLLVTHRTAMLPLVDRLVVLDQGMVVADGPRDEILRQLQGVPKTKGQQAA
ncbi:MAG: type I secretion system permease/ATPase [Rhodocyclaceae bacterium]|nr:type I secretion system permease/ATPase [Rhodocyclaceae bacterium]MCP5233676.1 type I secretion system permease/ATPase [Zoogloeaceae bacterium]MCB1913261.1 type I secretion system permease/ATPase [Rhodocyclaceae bacterium]MCP5240237.1 type I secretion system permease/ATPase [Zoogloeaceae bacterium]MCP5253654.1 type I secretion system permease/ATPase [Zoogloeaceae bacterium]